MDKFLAAAGQAASSGAIGNIAGQLANAANTTSVADFAQGALEKGMGAYDSMDPAAKAKLGAAGKAALPGFLQAAQAAATAAGAPGASAALGGILSGDTAGVPNPGKAIANAILGAAAGKVAETSASGAAPAAAAAATPAVQAAPVAAVPVATPVAAPAVKNELTDGQITAAMNAAVEKGATLSAAANVLMAGKPPPQPGFLQQLGTVISGQDGAGRKKRRTYRKKKAAKKAAKRAARKTGRKLRAKPRSDL